MSSALNVRVGNGINSIAQGDSASTIVLELLDNHKLPMPFLDGEVAKVTLIGEDGLVWYDSTVKVFDSLIEFAVKDILNPGLYSVDIRIEIDDSVYVFPKQHYQLRVTKSATHTMTDIVYKNGVEVVKNAVLEELSLENISPHIEDTGNPHDVTKTQIGLGNVSNVKQASKSEFDYHVEDSGNPHNVTKSQVGLSNVDNVKQATKTEFDSHVNDSDAHVSESERSAWNNKSNITLGESSSTAYRGDRGKIAYDHSQSAHAPTNAQKNSDITKTEIEEKLTGNIDSHTHTVTKADVGLGSVDNHGKASQSEAEEGTSDSKYMTPLRTKQAIDAMAPEGGSGGGGIEILNIPIVRKYVASEIFEPYMEERISYIPGFGISVNITGFVENEVPANTNLYEIPYFYHDGRRIVLGNSTIRYYIGNTPGESYKNPIIGNTPRSEIYYIRIAEDIPAGQIVSILGFVPQL